MRKLLPILLALLGLAAGVGAGIALKPPSAPMECGAPNLPPCPEPEAADPNTIDENSGFEYVRLDNQFVVPIVEDGSVRALVVLSLAVEVEPGATEKVLLGEPKLRDALLRVLFDHAHGGGFDGSFTLSGNLDVLQHALRETARGALGPEVNNVLIQNVLRQDN